MPARMTLVLALFPLFAGCGDMAHDTTDAAAHEGHDAADVGTSDVGTTDVGTATDQPTAVDVATTDQDAATDAGTVADAATVVPLLNDCRAADYVDRSADDAERTVVPRGTTGYTPRCLTIRTAQSVTFSMSFTTHPLIPGVPHGSSAGATTPSPIEAQRVGTTYAVTFPGAGLYPFYCNTHGHVGMAGVVRVLP